MKEILDGKRPYIFSWYDESDQELDKSIDPLSDLPHEIFILLEDFYTHGTGVKFYKTEEIAFSSLYKALKIYEKALLVC